MTKSLLPAERIERSILLIRQQKVLFDADLAGLYNVSTRILVQAVLRNRDRSQLILCFNKGTQW